MRRRLVAALVLGQALGGCVAATTPALLAAGATPTSLELIDTARDRPVPLLLYRPASRGPHRLAILSHGYGAQPDDYDFIARRLATRGWLVAAVDHELPGDPPIPTGGEPRVVRAPNWRVGADTLGFVASALREKGLADQTPLLLVGHSNGGDMAMVFAGRHPDDVQAVISLDNRRAPWPRHPGAKILSLRSSDQVADAGVIPSPDEARTLDLTITPVATRHDDMGDAATEAQQAQMLAVIDAFLKRIAP